jgi:hypothetical protein
MKDSLSLVIEDIPDVAPPRQGSSEHMRDIEAVKYSFLNPCFSGKFLELSDKKAEEIFKNYSEQTGIKFNEKSIKDLCSQLKPIIDGMKIFYKRPRPKFSIELYDEDFPHDEIKESESYSYPSGHTAMAYFVANIISNNYPKLRSDLETIAEMIGQSRIDNGVHYPSDVFFGRYIGELAAENVTSNNNIVVNRLSNNDVCKFFKSKAMGNNDYVHDLAEFIRRSNEIERYSINYDDCLAASKDFLAGYPIEYCTENKYIRSHLAALRKSASLPKINSLKDIIEIHKSLGDDVIENENGAGSIRNFSHLSRSGVKYPEPSNIIKEIDEFLSLDLDPFASHAFYEWVHPFCDGNGRSGRIILANQLDYDFEKVLRHIGNDYLPNIIKMTSDIADFKF